MPAPASEEPLPYVAAFTVAQMVDRVGTPPGIPGLQVVVRSVGSSWADACVAKHSRPNPIENERLAFMYFSYSGARPLGRPKL
jgi:hypothetical protein